MLKVLFFELSDTFGGIESFLLNILENIDLKNREDLHFDFVTSEDKPAGKEVFEKAGANIVKVSRKKNILKYRNDLDKLLGNGKYNIVHIQKNSLSNPIPAQMSIKHNVPYILHIQNSAPSMDNIATKISHYINRDIYGKRAALKLACGELAARWMFKTLDGVKIIKNGINPDGFRRNEDIRRMIRNQYCKGSELVVCNVGRFTEQKNHRFIIDVFYELRKIHENSKLFLVGDGQNFNSIKTKVHDLKIEKDVVFFGSLSRDKESQILMASDVYLMPSLYEGVSIASVEAQMSGLSLLVSDTVDKDTNITGNVTFMSLDESPKVWAEKLLKCVYKDNNHIDSDRLEADIRNAGYDMKNTTEWLLRTYAEKGNSKRD